MQELLLGKSFVDSNTLNILIMLVEIAAVMGFYATPAIIYRYSIRETPLGSASAKKFTGIFTVAYILLIAVIIGVVHISILTILGVLIWVPFNYWILIGNDNIIIRLFDKYQEIAVYLIVGVITTVVAWTVFYLLSFVLDSNDGFQLTINTILNWTAGVLVAYPMNRSWVFKSKSDKKLKEFLEFVASRITTLIIEEVVMLLCVDVIGLNQYLSKYVIASILVIILNYVFSKLFVFKAKK